MSGIKKGGLKLACPPKAGTQESIVSVTVFASAKKEKFIKKDKCKFEIFVKEPAMQNLANRRVLQLLAEYFELLPRNLEIISGHRSPRKKIKIKF